jgi:hypothetical protein
MNEWLTRQVVNDRQSELLAEAQQRSLARRGPHKEPIVRFRLTIELQLGRRKLGTVDHVHAS